MLPVKMCLFQTLSNFRTAPLVKATSSISISPGNRNKIFYGKRLVVWGWTVAMARPYPPAGAWSGCLMPSHLRGQCYLVGQVGPQAPHPAQVQSPSPKPGGSCLRSVSLPRKDTASSVRAVDSVSPPLPEGLGNGLPTAHSAWSFWVSFKTNRWGRPGLSL